MLLIKGSTVALRIMLAGAIFMGATAVHAETPPEQPQQTHARTAAEISAGVIPSDPRYPAGDVRRYGAIGNGVQDDTRALQSALDSGSGVHIAKPPAFYKTDQLQVPSNIEIFIESGTIIEANPGYEYNHAVFRIVDQANVKISGYGATVRMLKEQYDGEHRHGFAIRGSKNVEIEGVASNDAGGDGFIIAWGKIYPAAENVVLRDVSADNNRRQGLSIVSGKNIRVINSRFTNTNGTPPTAGIDIEPDGNKEFLEDILLENIYTEGNGGPGIKFDLRRLGGDVDKTVSIKIINHTDKRSAQGIYISKLEMGDFQLDGHIEIFDPVSIEPRTSAIVQKNYDALGPRIDIHHPTAIRPNRANTPSISIGAAFLVYRDASDVGANNIGNIHFHDPVIVDDRPRAQVTNYFYFRDETRKQQAEDVLNVGIYGTIDASRGKNRGAPRMVVFDGAGEVEDAGGLLVRHLSNENFRLTFSDYVRTVTNTGSTRPVTVTLDAVPVGWPAITFEVVASQVLRITPDPGSRIVHGSGSPGRYTESSEVGARLTLRRTGESEWTAEEQVGSWTYE
jgi:hypothetical protein